MTYPLLNNVTGVSGILIYANTATQSWFSVLFLYSLMIIIFVLLKQRAYRTSDSLSVASIICLILGGLFWAAGLIPSKHILLTLIIVVLSFIYSMFED